MAQRHTDINVGDWLLTLKGYGYAVGSDLGLAVLALAGVGLIVFLIAERFSAKSRPVLGLLTIIPFFLYSLEAGYEPISLPQQGILRNYRVGLVVAVPAAILIGYLGSKFPATAVMPSTLTA